MKDARYIYFIQAGNESRPTKIGWARDPMKRLADMQVAVPDHLRLLATVPGTAKDERELHERFSAGWIRGEWFEASTPGLRDLIDGLISAQIAAEIECAQVGREMYERKPFAQESPAQGEIE